MAKHFDHPAEDIEAVRKSSTTIEVTFKIRDPSKTSTLEASIKTANGDVATLSAALKEKIGYTVSGVAVATSSKSNKI